MLEAAVLLLDAMAAELLAGAIPPPVPAELLLATWLDVEAWLDARLLLADPVPPAPPGPNSNEG